MKRVLLISIFVLTMFLTGCVANVDQNIIFDDTESGTFVYSMYFSAETYDLVQAQFDAAMDQLEESDENITVEPYDQDGQKGATITLVFEDLDTLVEYLEDDDIIVNYEENDDGSVSFELEYVQSTTAGDDTDGTLYYDISISVPKIIDNNAEEVEGRTMHWDFDSTETNTVTFTFANTPVYVTVLKIVGYVALAGVVGGIGFIGFKMATKKPVDTTQVTESIQE